MLWFSPSLKQLFTNKHPSSYRPQPFWPSDTCLAMWNVFLKAVFKFIYVVCHGICCQGNIYDERNERPFLSDTEWNGAWELCESSNLPRRYRSISNSRSSEQINFGNKQLTYPINFSRIRSEMVRQWYIIIITEKQPVLLPSVHSKWETALETSMKNCPSALHASFSNRCPSHHHSCHTYFIRTHMPMSYFCHRLI